MINNLKELLRKEDLTIRKIENQFYLITFYSCYEVNEIGAAIVNIIGQDLPVKELGIKLAQKYGNDDVDQVTADALSFINFLLEEGLVTLEQK